jgi:antitoxin (DNA-binding transcriptional repressor) of toxin-antitoxin stability system
VSKVSVEEACRNLKILLEQVAKGEEVILLEQDRIVARLVPPLRKEEVLSQARKLRESLAVTDEPLSQTVIKLRQEERY